MSNNKVKNQDSMSQEDMQEYLTYILSGKVEDEKHAKKLRRLTRRTTNMSDVTVVIKAFMYKQEKTITQLMEAVHIQQKVLDKLGATDEMFKEAEKEYTEEIKELQKQIKEYEDRADKLSKEEQGKAKDDGEGK